MVSGSAAKLLLAWLLNGRQWLPAPAMMRLAGLSRASYFTARKELEASPLFCEVCSFLDSLANSSPKNDTPVQNSELGTGENFLGTSSKSETDGDAEANAAGDGLQPVTDAVRAQWYEAEARWVRAQQLRRQGKRGGTW